MKNTLAILLLSLPIFSCKEEKETWKVNYKLVNETVGKPSSVRVSFTNETGGTQLNGVVSDGIWTSDTFLFQDDDLVRFKLERVSGDAEYRMEILRNGAVHEGGVLFPSDEELEISDFI